MINPAADLHMVVFCIGFSFVDEFLKEVSGVAVHVGGTQMDTKSLRHVVDCLIVQLEAFVEGEKAAAQYQG